MSADSSRLVLTVGGSSAACYALAMKTHQEDRSRAHLKATNPRRLAAGELDEQATADWLRQHLAAPDSI